MLDVLFYHKSVELNNARHFRTLFVEFVLLEADEIFGLLAKFGEKVRIEYLLDLADAVVLLYRVVFPS